MRTRTHRYLLIAGILALCSFAQHSLLHATPSYWSIVPGASVEIVLLNSSVQNDSVTLHWKILVTDLRVRSTDSHVLVPILMDAHNSLSLPRIVISGRKRASYDTRERTLDPFQRRPYSISVYHRRRPVEPIYYSVTFPYATWMEHCSLDLRQLRESAWQSKLLISDRLCRRFPLRQGSDALDNVTLPSLANIDVSLVPVLAPQREPVPAPEPQVTPQVTPQVIAPVVDSLPPIRIALYLSYPIGFSGVNALFSDNAAELAKADRLLLPLLDNPRLRIRRILVTGYTSPDGIYANNEQLAKKRTQEFVRYLRAAYPLPAGTTVRTAWVAEDWEGLRMQLQQSDIPLRNRGLAIIDHTGIFDGRERALMNLDGGNFYRTIKATLFPKLRRIELVVEQEARE